MSMAFLSISCISWARTEIPIMVSAILIDNQQVAIQDTLKPLIDSGINNFLLCSDPSDTTTEKAKEFLFAQGASVKIDTKKFDDQGARYNYIVSETKKLFPDADFVLLSNGQWLLHNVKSLIDFCVSVKDNQSPVYWIKLFIHGMDEDFYMPCLVRVTSVVEFKGMIDPAPQKIQIEKAPSEVFFEWNKIQWGISHAQQSLTNTLVNLLKAYNRDRHDPKLVFDLACTYEALGDLKSAYAYYTMRSTMEGNKEHDYLAVYRLAKLLDSVTEDKDIWQLQEYYYLKAHEIRSTRAEPLVKIAQHYLKCGNNHLAFLFARQASLITYPDHDCMSIERHAYEYTPFDILGITGWYLQEFEIGQMALKKALIAQPYNTHLLSNLDFYIKRKETQHNESQKRDPRIPAGFGVDFHDSMKHGFAYNYTTIETDPFLKKIKDIYEKYTITDVQYLDAPRIPKIIHHIWLGSELPDKYKAWQQTWLIHHPEWEYRLWTQKEIDELGLKNRAQFDAALTYGEKSDIARYEILYKFGGVYSDSDFECIAPMDVFHHCCDFYAGLEGTTAVIGNSIIGSAPEHPILKRCIDNLRGAQKGKEGWQYVVDRTGPGHLTACVKAEIMTDAILTSRTVIFPACYFFPWYPVRPEPRPLENVIKSLRPETFALHLWESSWVK